MVSTTQQHQAYNQEFSLDDWILVCASQYTDAELKPIRQAGELVLVAHKHQRRASGEPYVHHVFAVAEIVSKLNMDHETVCAAILHDVVEDTDVTLEQIESEFGAVIASMVNGVTKMSQIQTSQGNNKNAESGRRDKEWANAENLRKLLLAMVDDVRVVLIKLADRLHNMRTLNFLPEANQKRIATETMEIFAPLANRMGIWQIKWELEDLSLRYLEPVSYKSIARMLDERRVDREQYIDNSIVKLKTALATEGIEASIAGRPKHIYSIWKKMKRKGVDFHEIFDVRAVRIVVSNLAECYGALGVVHTLWKHIPREFDDYIATPKGNMYQSLHTAVIGPEGRTLEVQIRTPKMDEHAELGVAAHWRYKEGGHFDEAFEQKIAWLRQLLEWKEEEPSAGDFINRFKAEAFEDRVYVLTPRGNVVDLPLGATPLDFAYYIHTDIGHRCRGAKVDGSIVPLTYQLQNGEQVEVLTTRNGTPSRDWLNPNLGYLRTSRARAKARSWFKHQDQDQNIADGHVILIRELGRLRLSAVKPEQLISRFHCQTVDELLAQIGRGEITTGKLANAAHELLKPHHQDTKVLREVSEPSDKEMQGDVSIQGVGNLLTRIARCCKPVPNDSIVGFITLGRGVTIHRSDCPNILRLPTDKRARMIEVAWNTAPLTTYPVDIQVLAYDRQGLLRDVTQILTNSSVNVLAVNTMTDVKDHMARMNLTVEVVDTGQLSDMLERIRQLRNVVEAHRKE